MDSKREHPRRLLCIQRAHISSTLSRGNVAQLGVALARTFQPGAIRGFHMPDKQALCSLLSFLLGTSVGRIGDKIGNNSRRWLISATIIQALMLMAAALLAHFGEKIRNRASIATRTDLGVERATIWLSTVSIVRGV